ncbi:MAG: VOC family protein [Alphaproteobacteria bacterium]|nr:VOC family protein [Alphaproteobacteria bacterium]
MAAARKPLRRTTARTTGKTKAARKATARKPARKPARVAARPSEAFTTPDGITLHRMDHLTIRARLEDMETLRDFYAAVLGLKAGKRPDFAFHGYWMYMGDRAVIHLAGNARPDLPAGQSGSHVGFDHVSFRTSGLPAVRARLKKLDVPFEEVPVPGFPLHQIFFRDPTGMKVELTFDVAELHASPA